MATQQIESLANGGEQAVAELLERLRREPSLRAWVLQAPTGALASLGVALDDHDISNLLDAVEAMDERPIPVTARDVMTPDPVTVSPQTSAHEAAQLLSERRVSGLPVRDFQGSLVGVLSEFDLIARSGQTVGEIMTRDVKSVRESATLDEVRAVFVSQRLKRVPVVDVRGQLVGIITRADLVRELAYRWQCRRCGNLVRSRHAPEGCPRCGAADQFAPAPPEPTVKVCPTCNRPLESH